MNLLVIGYGNTLRCDDGVGPKAAEAVAAFNLPGARVISCQQLTPELAEPIAKAGVVVFIDASMDVADHVEWRPVPAQNAGEGTTHASSPSGLLMLAQQAFGRQPPAWMVAIPVQDMGIGERLSARAAAGVQAAAAQIKAFSCRRSRRAKTPQNCFTDTLR